MPVKTPNNFFAEDRMGDLSAEVSREVTIKGLVRRNSEQQSMAKVARDLDRPRQKKLLPRVAAGVALTGATLLAVNGLRSNNDTTPTKATGIETTTSSTNPEVSTPPTSIHTVKKGDTLWGIAREAHPNEEVRPVVDEMQKAHGGNANLQVGERIPVPVDQDTSKK